MGANINLGPMFDKWVDRLRLNDWDISVNIVSKEALPPNRSGLCNSVLAKKIARISILDPSDADPTWLKPYDFELTFVHELCHLHLAPWAMMYDEEDAASEILLEQAVHVFSTALIEADRRSDGWQ